MSSQNLSLGKTEKEIKAEVLGLLGTLKEKMEFVRKCSDKYLLVIFNSLYKDPNFKDGSEIAEYRIYQLMLDRPDCPQEIVMGCLSMPWFDGQDYVYRSKFVETAIVDKACEKTINEVQANWRLTQAQLNLLTSILHSPNLSRKMRLKLEKLSDQLSEKYINDSLVSCAVKFTKRQSWLCTKYSQYLQGGSGDISFIKNVVSNPLCKPFMVDYACRLCTSQELASQLATNPQISIQGLELLRAKFRTMGPYLDKLISRQIEDNDE